MKKTVWLLLLLAYCSFIFFLSAQSNIPKPLPFAHQDKLFHAGAYGLLAFIALGYFAQVLGRARRALFAALIFTVLYAISDEWHQSFVVGREADVLDILADTVGALLALWLMSYFREVPYISKVIKLR